MILITINYNHKSRFWDAVQELKRVHSRDVGRKVEAIWKEYLAQGEYSYYSIWYYQLDEIARISNTSNTNNL